MTATTTADSAASDAALTGPAIVSTPEEAQALIRRVSTRKKKSVVYTEQAIQDDVNEKEPDGGFDSPLTELDEEVVEKSPKKKRRRRKEQEPVVYDIAPVETKTTTFTGASPGSRVLYVLLMLSQGASDMRVSIPSFVHSSPTLSSARARVVSTRSTSPSSVWPIVRSWAGRTPRTCLSSSR